MIKFTLVFQSLLNRWLSCLLIIITLAFSISLFFTVSRIQETVKSSFQNTVSGVDSVVAGRGGNLQILLNSVFLIGEPSNTIKWDTFEDITSNKQIKWAVPISLGDSHKGFRVISTNNDYFKEIKYSSGKKIEFNSGKPFNDVFDVVLGECHSFSYQNQFLFQFLEFHVIAFRFATCQPVLLNPLLGFVCYAFPWGDLAFLRFQT